MGVFFRVWQIPGFTLVATRHVRFQLHINTNETIFFQGVTNSFCYLGTHGTCFPLHTEDMDLGAVNYLHWGKPKVWYVVALCDAEKMENKICDILEKSGNLKVRCENIMRHKDYLVTPEFLSKHNIKFTVYHQNAGEFMITFPRGYHQGFNLGLNFAEATNYANQRWVEIGRRARQCSCRDVEPIFSMDIFDDI